MQTRKRLMCLVLAALFLQACATGPSANTRGSQAENGDEGLAADETPIVNLADLESARATDPELPRMANEELDRIPVEINPMVEKWIAYFQGRGRPHMERYLSRMNRYSKVMKKILRQNGMPEDLIFIAMIESGFSAKATSHASAVGYWQFIRGTGRRYGMEINALVDERRDPILSTQAAAEYFKGLYSIFGSWYLAMASYNAGENRIQRKVMENKTRDFWELARKRQLPIETINYVPKYIAAKLIGNNPKKFGFEEIEYIAPIEFDHIQVDRPVNLKKMADTMNFDYDDFKSLNPKFKGEIAPVKGSKGLELRIPVGQQEQAMAAAQTSFVDRVEFVADAGETESYRVRSGDSLYTIAKKYRTTVAWLRDVNDLKAGRKLRIGMRMQVPDRNGRSTPSSKSLAKAQPRPVKADNTDESAVARTEVVTPQGLLYVVQPGDTLSGIADDYDSSVEELRKMNKLGRRAMLRAGLRLKVPPKDEGLPSVPSGVARRSDKVRSTASAGVTHVVRSGENLTVIAKKYGVSIQQIRSVNNFSRRTVLKVGSVLIIPSSPSQGSRLNSKAKVHVVRRGENLSHIADKYKISVNNLRKHNDLQMASKLFVGARLLIPSANASARVGGKGSSKLR